MDRRRHVVVANTARAEPFTSPSAGGTKFRIRATNRGAHSAELRRQLDRIQAELARRREQGAAIGVEDVRGFYLEFESPPGFLLKLQSLENLKHGIALAATRLDGQRQLATVFVPQGQLTFFIKRVEQYATRLDTRSQKPKHQSLVESISKIRLAVVESFWTDPPEMLPPRDSVVWLEAWLRGDTGETRTRFERIARGARLELADEVQTFPERTVVLVRASLLQLAGTLDALDMLAELRRVKQIGGFFMRLGRQERSAWLADLRSRISLDATTSVAVTILDSGVQRSHALLAPLLAASDLHAWLPAWRAEQDHHGHGTEMAGIAAYGNLAHAMLSAGPIALTHRLESVKILPPQGQNPEHLYGRVTADGVRKAEIQEPERSRVFSLALAADAKDRGQPTAWSAEIDKLAAGVDDEERRLFFVCAGNVWDGVGKNYPAQNLSEGIHDPGQSWNAVTVGAYTELAALDEPQLAGWSCIAPPGCISPSSTTSAVWEPKWPLKPDFVMEGGNMALSPAKTDADAPDSLSILTTYFRDERPFTSTGDTSAATAAAARYAALLRVQYPGLWPESIRALLVDSAEWTPAMQKEIRGARDSSGVELALRCFGFGTPKLERALWSAGNALTLIAQDELQPFTEDRSNEMNLHALPWPSAELEQLGDVEVELRVTLSYFIEPNPARRGWKNRHRYASHGLRFAVQKPNESVPSLRKRVNKDARDEDEELRGVGDAEGWLLKPNLRGKGSLHHDRWTGTAVELSRRSNIAVFPVIGWWRERLSLGRSESKARYSLVVTIRSPVTSVDIYQAVAIQLGIPVATSS